MLISRKTLFLLGFATFMCGQTQAGVFETIGRVLSFNAWDTQTQRAIVAKTSQDARTAILMARVALHEKERFDSLKSQIREPADLTAEARLVPFSAIRKLDFSFIRPTCAPAVEKVRTHCARVVTYIATDRGTLPTPKEIDAAHGAANAAILKDAAPTLSEDGRSIAADAAFAERPDTLRHFFKLRINTYKDCAETLSATDAIPDPTALIPIRKCFNGLSALMNRSQCANTTDQIQTLISHINQEAAQVLKEARGERCKLQLQRGVNVTVATAAWTLIALSLYKIHRSSYAKSAYKACGRIFGRNSTKST